MSNESITHKKTIIVFVAEINKLLNDFSPPKMDDIFEKQENYYSLRKPCS